MCVRAPCLCSHLASLFAEDTPLPPVMCFAMGTLGFLTPFDAAQFRSCLVGGQHCKLETHTHAHTPHLSPAWLVVLNCNQRIDRQTTRRTGSLGKAVDCCPHIMCELTAVRVLRLLLILPGACVGSQPQAAVLHPAHTQALRCAGQRWAAEAGAPHTQRVCGGQVRGLERCRGALVAGGSAQCQLQPAADDREFHNTIVTTQQCCTHECGCAHVCVHLLSCTYSCVVVRVCCLQRCLPLLCVPGVVHRRLLCHSSRGGRPHHRHPQVGRVLGVGGCVSSKRVGVARRLRSGVTPVFVSTLGFDSCHPQHDAALPCPALPCSGSTAYSMSAGGSMVAPSVPCTLVTPLSPHSLSFRPLIIGENADLMIRLPEDARSHARQVAHTCPCRCLCVQAAVVRGWQDGVASGCYPCLSVGHRKAAAGALRKCVGR